MGFFSLQTAWNTLQGYESMNMIRKGQMHGVVKGDIAFSAWYSVPTEARRGEISEPLHFLRVEQSRVRWLV